MGSFDAHMRQYEAFFQDAEQKDLSFPSKAELYFLAAYQLIEACCAKKAVHINKHQHMRRILESNKEVFGEETGRAWRAFQVIENQLRPKFVYGGAWDEADERKLRESFKVIRQICLKVLGR